MAPCVARERPQVFVGELELVLAVPRMAPRNPDRSLHPRRAVIRDTPGEAPRPGSCTPMSRCPAPIHALAQRLGPAPQGDRRDPPGRRPGATGPNGFPPAPSPRTKMTPRPRAIPAMVGGVT